MYEKRCLFDLTFYRWTAPTDKIRDESVDSPCNYAAVENNPRSVQEKAGTAEKRLWIFRSIPKTVNVKF